MKGNFEVGVGIPIELQVVIARSIADDKAILQFCLYNNG